VDSVLSVPCIGSGDSCPVGQYCNVNGDCASCFTLPNRDSCFDGALYGILILPKDSATCASVCFDLYMPFNTCRNACVDEDSICCAAKCWIDFYGYDSWYYWHPTYCQDDPCHFACTNGCDGDACCESKCADGDYSGNTCDGDPCCEKKCADGDNSVDTCNGDACCVSKCVDGAEPVICDDADDCCLAECKRRAICDRFDGYVDEEKKKKGQCQRRKSTCRFVPNNLSVGDKLGVDGECKYKMPVHDVCNTFGGGCLLSTTSTSQGACVIKEGRRCMQNGCNYQVLPDQENNLISECVSKTDGKQDSCTDYNDNLDKCNKNKKCVYDPCTKICSFDCKKLSKDKCLSKRYKYKCRYNAQNENKRCLNQ